MGLGALVAVPDEYTPQSLQALDAWLFCGGWRPERLALYGAQQRVDDWARLIDGLIVIRDVIEHHRAERRK